MQGSSISLTIFAMSSEQSDITLELNLLDSGVDFIFKGIDELFDEDHVLREYSTAIDISLSGYKYVVIHLFSGFLLLLKERLSRHLPELIFKGKLNEVKQKLSSGKTPNTIDLDEALERLEVGPKVVFSKDEIDVIRSIQDIRNQFEHYKLSVNKFYLWENVSRFLELVDKFLVHELQISIETSSASFSLQQKIHTIDSVWKRVDLKRKQDWKDDAESRLKRFKRNRKKILQDLETDYYLNKGAEESFTTCPDCYEYTLIAYGEYEGICSNLDCNNVNPLKECNRCGSLMPGFSWDFDFCESCIEWIGEQ
jgi:hypothetical protein